jgi:hypothetical protein
MELRRRLKCSPGFKTSAVSFWVTVKRLDDLLVGKTLSPELEDTRLEIDGIWIINFDVFSPDFVRAKYIPHAESRLGHELS